MRFIQIKQQAAPKQPNDDDDDDDDDSKSLVAGKQIFWDAASEFTFFRVME